MRTTIVPLVLLAGIALFAAPALLNAQDGYFYEYDPYGCSASAPSSASSAGILGWGCYVHAYGWDYIYGGYYTAYLNPIGYDTNPAYGTGSGFSVVYIEGSTEMIGYITAEAYCVAINAYNQSPPPPYPTASAELDVTDGGYSASYLFNESSGSSDDFCNVYVNVNFN